MQALLFCQYSPQVGGLQHLLSVHPEPAQQRSNSGLDFSEPEEQV
jgi:hypothetical protein